MKLLKNKANEIAFDVKLILNDLIYLITHVHELVLDVVFFWKDLKLYNARWEAKLRRFKKKFL